MAAKAEALAKQFEAKVQEATAMFERLTDADWKKTTASEKWTVGVVPPPRPIGAFELTTSETPSIRATGQCGWVRRAELE